MSIVVVYGPPCSGKSTYVQNRLKNDDVVFDYDKILRALTNRKKHETEKSLAHDLVLALRDKFIYKIQNRQSDGIAYILTRYPSEYIRKQLPENSGFVRMKTTQAECLEYLKKIQKEQIRQNGKRSLNVGLKNMEKRWRICKLRFVQTARISAGM